MKWTPEKIARLVALYQTTTRKDIAREMGISFAAVRGQVCKLLANGVLQHKNKRPSKRRTVDPPDRTVTTIIEQECEATGLGVTAMMIWAGDRRPAVCYVRGLVVKRLCASGNYSYTAIGRALGMDHSSVLYLRKRNWQNPPKKLPKEPEIAPECPKLRFSTEALFRPKPKLPPSEITVPLARLMGARA